MMIYALIAILLGLTLTRSTYLPGLWLFAFGVRYDFRRSILIDVSALIFIVLLVPDTFVILARRAPDPAMFALAYVAALLISGMYVVVNLRRELVQLKASEKRL